MATRPRLVRPCVGTKEDFVKAFAGKEDIHKIHDAEVYWGDDGTLFLVLTPDWRDYLTGRRTQIPDYDFGDFDSDFDIDRLLCADGGV